MATLQRLVPCLWFNGQAEEAARFYVSVFERSRIDQIARYVEEGREIHGQTPGTVLTVGFELEGQRFSAINGGAEFAFSPAISFQVMCETQQEIDRYWTALSAGSDETAQQCGWLKDKYGVCWQIVPAVLPAMMTDRDPARVGRVMKVLMHMKKLDLAKLKQAYGN